MKICIVRANIIRISSFPSEFSISKQFVKVADAKKTIHFDEGL